MADGTGRLLAVDPQICEIMRRHEGDLLGRTYQDFTHPDDRARNVSLVGALRVGDGPLDFVKRYVRPDGSSVSAKVRVSRLGAVDGGHLLGTIEPIDATASQNVRARWLAAQLAAKSIKQRRTELGDDLFGDYAYALLLQTYLAEAEGRLASLGELIEQVEVPPKVAARWMRILATRGLVEAVADADGCPQLTSLGAKRVERLLDFYSGA